MPPSVVQMSNEGIRLCEYCDKHQRIRAEQFCVCVCVWIGLWQSLNGWQFLCLKIKMSLRRTLELSLWMDFYKQNKSLKVQRDVSSRDIKKNYIDTIQVPLTSLFNWILYSSLFRWISLVIWHLRHEHHHHYHHHPHLSAGRIHLNKDVNGTWMVSM